jgi:hypothetical protein
MQSSGQDESDDSDDEMCAQWNRVYESRPWRSLFGSKVKSNGNSHFRFEHQSALIMLWQDFPELLAGWPGMIQTVKRKSNLFSENDLGRHLTLSNGLSINYTACRCLQIAAPSGAGSATIQFALANKQPLIVSSH